MNDVMLPNQLPAYLRDYQSDNHESLITGGTVLPRISIRGKQFRFRKDGQERALKLGQTLKVVILGGAPAKGCAKAYYEHQYSEDGQDAPDCSSADGIHPDAWLANPVAPACVTCPKNQFGSGVDRQGNATKGKACGDAKQLMVLPPDDPEGDIWMLRTPATSLKLLSAYATSLIKHKIPIEAVITEIFFEDSEYPKINFKYTGFVDEAVAPAFFERVKSPEFQELLHTAVAEPQATAVDTPVQSPVQKPKAPVQSSVQKPIDDSIFDGMPEEEEESEADAAFGDGGATSATAIKPSTQPEAPLTVNPMVLPDGSYAIDKTGTAFDPKVHSRGKDAMGGSLNKDGTFKARRNGSKADEPQKAETKPAETPPAKKPSSMFGQGDDDTSNSQASDADELDSLLDKWASDD